MGWLCVLTVNSTVIGEHQRVPLEINNWTVSKNMDTREIAVTTASGYHFLFKDDLSVLALLLYLADRKFEFKTLQDERLTVDEFGHVVVIQSDPWVNRGWKFGDVICEAWELATTIGEYISREWLKKTLENAPF